MGIFVDGLSIIVGGLFGCLCKKHIPMRYFSILEYCVMFLALTGIVENIFCINNGKIENQHIVLIVMCLYVGNIIGEKWKIDEKVSRANLRLSSNSNEEYITAIIFGCIFFGVGGLQLTGPILLAVNADSSQLLAKSAVDFPLAVSLGAVYGFGISLSALPVMLLQGVIFVLAVIMRDFIDNSLMRQICVIGYAILFFSGLNICNKRCKVKTVNLLPSLGLVILCNLILRIVG